MDTITLSPDRLETLESIRKITDYEKYNLYTMDVKYGYELERLMLPDAHDTQRLMGLAFEEALPGVSMDYKAPDYGGCSVFCAPGRDGNRRFGRNYDFKFNTSCMLVRCHPKGGYRSVSHAAIDNLQVNDPFASGAAKAACLVLPFIVIDGMNEKGVGIGVLTLNSKPVDHRTGKPVLATTVLIRLVLDRAATTEEAVKLLSAYDMYAISGRDYHFFITDKSGDSRIVEFDCDDPARRMVVTDTRAATNFYIMYKDRVLPRQDNGSYGHGRERYDAIEDVLNEENGVITNEGAWRALRAASQEPNPAVVTSNTQWSIAYDLTRLTHEISIRRKFEDRWSFELN